MERLAYNLKQNKCNIWTNREKWFIAKGGSAFSKLVRLDRADLPKFPEILVVWIALYTKSCSFSSTMFFFSNTCGTVLLKLLNKIV